ncbi:MAG TPA: ferritin-like domain-containing protein [Flavobacterium sp.]|jgi:hypothetical protein
MNIIKFIESFTDDALLQQPTSRRGSLTQFGDLGKKAALAAVPGGLLALMLAPQKSSANVLLPDPTTEGPVSALQLGLMLEYLDSTFYQMGLDSAGLIPAGRDRTVFERIVLNENAHKASLIAALGGTGSPNYFAPPEFDFTANGLFPDPFNNYDIFLTLSQAFEDTGVRAYKGQAPNLMSTPDLLTTALQIHSAESRQAAMVRMLRMEKGWITGSQMDAGMNASLQPVYAGEGNTTQMGINISNLNNGSQGPALSANAATQAFDEPLTRPQVLAIADPFVEGEPLTEN